MIPNLTKLSSDVDPVQIGHETIVVPGWHDLQVASDNE